mmetsp:Transcript_6837/g.19482  ORF Transcript_6837/g.19482 Transcript_6837/m.19482 type:complete len:348 (+) Transcript_6837:79-1122(+)
MADTSAVGESGPTAEEARVMLQCEKDKMLTAAPVPAPPGMDAALERLFDTYALSPSKRRAFHTVKAAKNMPVALANLDDEQVIWAVAVSTFDMSDEPSPSDIKFFDRAVEERVRRLEEAERVYGWFTLKWTPPTMRRLILNWYCGMLTIDPALTTTKGSPIQFVREYYGAETEYPGPEGQTDAWKQESIDLYVLMARSTCMAYPMATTKGIVSFSDMQDFDWEKYDMSTKERNASIGALIPNKLARMITFHPDDKMRGFYKDMTQRMRRKYGFVVYDDFSSAVAGEADLLPPADLLPSFVGGSRRVDTLACLRYLFRREPEALALLEEVHDRMEAAGEIPTPKHMKL